MSKDVRTLEFPRNLKRFNTSRLPSKLSTMKKIDVANNNIYNFCLKN